MRGLSSWKSSRAKLSASGMAVSWKKRKARKWKGCARAGSSKAKRLRKLKPGLFNQLGGPAARGEGDGMDRSGAGWTQACSHRCGHLRGGVGKVSTRPPNGKWNRRCSFASAQSMGRTGLACGRIAAMPVATGEQSCKRQKFAFSFAGTKGM